jgi:hypothetical protein
MRAALFVLLSLSVPAFAGRTDSAGFAPGYHVYVAVTLTLPVNIDDRGGSMRAYPFQRVRCGDFDHGCTYEIPPCEAVTVMPEPGLKGMRVRDHYGAEITFRHMIGSGSSIVFSDRAACEAARDGR